MNFYELKPSFDILSSSCQNALYNSEFLNNDLLLQRIQSSFKNSNIFNECQSIEEHNVTESIEPINKEKFELEEMKNNLDLEVGNLEQIDILKLIKEDNKKKLEDSNSSYKSTGEKSKTEEKNITKVIFGTKTKKHKKPIEIRIDYAIKNIKTYITKFLKEYGNILVQKCHFSSLLKNLKLFAPSYPYFTGNAKDKDNKAFKNFTVEQILSYPPERKQNCKKDNRLQRQNKDIIKAFKDYIENNYPDERPDEYQELLNFFQMTYEDIIILFYDNSFQYKEFISSEKSKTFDKLFIKIKGYSLIEKKGFLKFINN